MTMAEREHLVDSEKIHYSGLVDLREFYLMIEKWILKNGYSKNEIQNTENIYEDKKVVTWVFYPKKMAADFIGLEMKIAMKATDVTDVVVKMDGHKKKIQNAKITVSLDAFYRTHDESRLREGPLRTLLRVFFFKFINNTFENKHQGKVVADVNSLRDTIRSFLKLHRYHELKE